MPDLKFPPFSYFLAPPEMADQYVFDEKSVLRLILPCGRLFYYSLELDVAVSCCNETGSYVFVAGLAVDLILETLESKSIAKSLLQDLENGKESFLRRTDFLAGRYIIVFRKSKLESPVVIGDASGALKINYSPYYKVCSSNIFLIDALLSGGKKVFRKEYMELRDLWKFGSLGDYTPLEGVKILTPNHSLALDGFKVDRFYPREFLPSRKDCVQVAEEIERYCLLQKSLLEKKYALVNSLTAGLDSRFSLSISYGRDSYQKYFTYCLKASGISDSLVSEEISNVLKLNHFLIYDPEKFRLRDFSSCDEKIFKIERKNKLAEEISKWCWYSHVPDLVNNYKGQFLDNEKPTLHIRSNLFEIGRSFYGRGEYFCKDESMILKLSRPDWDSGAYEVFSDFFGSTHLTKEYSFNFDLLDLFYWEHRCGTWVSEILQETDFAFNSVSYFNCRKIIELSLSVPVEDRVKGSIFKIIISKRLPEIADVPYNPIKKPLVVFVRKVIKKLGLWRRFGYF